MADRFDFDFAVSLPIDELELEWAPLAELRDLQQASRIIELLGKALSRN